MTKEVSSTSEKSSVWLRFDRVVGTSPETWLALAQTPGVGVSITDAQGRLLFVNDTTLVLFSGSPDIEYDGKYIADFHPPEFVAERLALIGKVIKDNKPLSIRHIYHGNPITSTVWPIRDKTPPFNRALVISRPGPVLEVDTKVPNAVESFETEYIDLGPLSVLTRRELEVLVLLGHGMSVPRAAAILHRSPKTVERHKESIGKKLALRGQSELVYLVTSMGLELSHAQLKRL